jgi:hypothetical protein
MRDPIVQPDAFFCMSDSEKDAIREFGHRVIGVHNAYAMVNVWPLAAAVVLQVNRLGDAMPFLGALGNEGQSLLTAFQWAFGQESAMHSFLMRK